MLSVSPLSTQTARWAGVALVLDCAGFEGFCQAFDTTPHITWDVDLDVIMQRVVGVQEQGQWLAQRSACDSSFETCQGAI